MGKIVCNQSAVQWHTEHMAGTREIRNALCTGKETVMPVKQQLCSYHEDHNTKQNEYPTGKKNTSYKTENVGLKAIGAIRLKKWSGLTSRIASLRALDVDDKPRSSTTRNFLNHSAPSM